MHRRVHLFVCAAFAAATFSACGGGGGGVPAAPTFVVSGLGSGTGTSVTLSAATSYALSAKETARGGASVTPGPLAITLGNAAIGTLSGTTLTTGVVNASGQVTVKDPNTGLSVTFTVTVLSTHPATVGDTLTLAGTLTHTIARPLPAPSAIAAPVTTTVNVTDVLSVPSVTATISPNPAVYIDEHLVETDAAPLQSIVTTSDAYASFASSSTGQTFAQAALTSTDSNGVIDNTTFGVGNGILDQLPDASGATFSNTAALTFLETEPDGTTVGRAVNADGTYLETDTYLGFPPASTTQMNPDLSAAITSFGYTNVNVAYGAPTGSGTSAAIPYTITIQAPSTAPPVTGTIPDWYPSTTVASDTFVKTTSVALPAACKIPTTVGTTGTQLAETTTRLDTGLGSYEKRTQSVYDVPGFGSLCIQLADEIDSYYDYTGQSSYGPLLGLNLALSSTPIQIDTIAETLGYVSATVSGSDVTRKSAQSISSNAMLRAATPMFDRAVAAVYRGKRDAAKAFFTTHRAALAKEFGR